MKLAAPTAGLMGVARICGTCSLFDALDKTHKPHLLDVIDVTCKLCSCRGIFIRSGVAETRALGGFFRSAVGQQGSA